MNTQPYRQCNVLRNMRSNRGNILITVYWLVLVLFIFGSAFFARAISEIRASEKYVEEVGSFLLADLAGAKTLFCLDRNIVIEHEYEVGPQGRVEIRDIDVTPLAVYIKTSGYYGRRLGGIMTDGGVHIFRAWASNMPDFGISAEKITFMNPSVVPVDQLHSTIGAISGSNGEVIARTYEIDHSAFTGVLDIDGIAVVESGSIPSPLADTNEDGSINNVDIKDYADTAVPPASDVMVIEGLAAGEEVTLDFAAIDPGINKIHCFVENPTDPEIPEIIVLTEGDGEVWAGKEVVSDGIIYNDVSIQENEDPPAFTANEIVVSGLAVARARMRASHQITVTTDGMDGNLLAQASMAAPEVVISVLKGTTVEIQPLPKLTRYNLPATWVVSLPGSLPGAIPQFPLPPEGGVPGYQQTHALPILTNDPPGGGYWKYSDEDKVWIRINDYNPDEFFYNLVDGNGANTGGGTAAGDSGDPANPGNPGPL